VECELLKIDPRVVKMLATQIPTTRCGPTNFDRDCRINAVDLYVQISTALQSDAASEVSSHLSECVIPVARDSSLEISQGIDGQSVGVVSDERQATRPIGRITAARGHWFMSNYSLDATFVVENMEGGGEFVKVAPCRADVPISFELARVVVPLARGLADIKVFSRPPAYVEPVRRVEVYSGADPWFKLDEDTKYFLVLVALCEPRLRHSYAVVVPSVPEIVERLSGLEVFVGLTRAAVNYHIEYLVSNKLRARNFAGTDQAGRMNGKREAIVDVALKYDLVRPEHLMLLPPRQVRASRQS
jgi:hypothetical protein